MTPPKGTSEARADKPHPSEQTIKHKQTLTEPWEVEYTRPFLGKPIVARLNWPHSTIYCVRGEGQTVEEARLDLAKNLAHAIAQDDDPLGRKDAP